MVLAADDAEGCKTAPTCDHRVFTTKKVIARTMVLWARPALSSSPGSVTADSACGRNSRFHRLPEDAALPPQAWTRQA